MKRSAQFTFPGFDIKDPTNFGGALLKKSNPTTKRSIVTKSPMHLVIKSSLAKGDRSFLRHDKRVMNVINTQAKKFGIKIYRLANAGNHIHMIILISNKRVYAPFIRAVTGLIARISLGCEKGKAWKTSLKQKFWDYRPFSRILTWGKDFLGAKNYLTINNLECLGMTRDEARYKVQLSRVVEVPEIKAFGFGRHGTG